MAFMKKRWKDRKSEYPNRRKLTPVAGQSNIYDMTRAEGLVTEVGDPFDSRTMNDLEERIAAAFEQQAVQAIAPPESYVKYPDQTASRWKLTAGRSGFLSLSGSLWRTRPASDNYGTAYGRIWKNGVLMASAATRTEESPGYIPNAVTVSAHLAVQPGDVVQIEMHSTVYEGHIRVTGLSNAKMQVSSVMYGYTPEGESPAQ